MKAANVLALNKVIKTDTAKEYRKKLGPGATNVNFTADISGKLIVGKDSSRKTSKMTPDVLLAVISELAGTDNPEELAQIIKNKSETKHRPNKKDVQTIFDEKVPPKTSETKGSVSFDGTVSIFSEDSAAEEIEV